MDDLRAIHVSGLPALGPCPFCSSDKIVLLTAKGRGHRTGEQEDVTFGVCAVCNATGPGVHTKCVDDKPVSDHIRSLAAANWNARGKF
jgi:hypothetical protein